MSDDGVRRFQGMLWIRRRWWTLAALVGFVVLTAAAFLTGACYYSDVLRDEALAVRHKPPAYEIAVVAVDGVTITLDAAARAPDADWQQAGLLGLEWPGGYGQIGRIVAVDIDTQVVTRDFMVLAGEIAAGAMVKTDGYAFPSDPTVGRDLQFRDVAVSSELGEFPAWLVSSQPDGPWAIFVHGKGARREESLRILPTVVAAGFTGLVITYRNDSGVAKDPSGYYRYGEREWLEVEAAVHYAVDHGAETVLLYGYSMGGGISLSFLYRSPLATAVCGAVLDAPMVDFGATIDFRADERNVPSILTFAGKRMAALRFNVRWGGLDYTDRADALDVPILLIHGGLDRDVPIWTSERLAELRPDLVSFETFEDARHVRSWNADPERYERLVGDFLGGLTGCR